MPDDDAEDGALARARARARRAAHGLVIVVAVLFIGASTIRIVHAVFAVGVVPVSDGPCVLGVRHLANALARGCAPSAKGVVDPNGSAASEPIRSDDVVAPAGRGPPPEHAPCAERGPWAEADAVARACATTSGGLDAWAALQRLRLAQEELARRDRTDLEPLERDVSAHLPRDLR